MAREAISRQFDVDEDKVVFKRLTHTGEYDQGTVTFQAKKGKLIALDKLHESVWATRLSGGTKSGLVRLDVTAVGRVVELDDKWILRVDGSREHFVLMDERRQREAKRDEASPFERLRQSIAGGETVVSVTGRLDGWMGVWPTVLRKLPPKPRRIVVSKFEVIKEQ